MHRDLKPENLLFDRQRHLQLTDFGSAKDLSGEASAAQQRDGESLKGTADYISPEAGVAAWRRTPPLEPLATELTPWSCRPCTMRRSATAPTCGRWAASSSTCWPVGCLEPLDAVQPAGLPLRLCLAQRSLCAGDPPFRDRSEYVTMERVSSADYSFCEEDHPADARSLISQLLRLEPTERLGEPPAAA